jgi:hypothetical protein
MKFKIALLVAFATIKSIYAQVPALRDTIVQRNGEKIPGRITSETPSHLIYDSSGVVGRIILLEDVFMIRYATGKHRIIDRGQSVSNPAFMPELMYRQGRNDAKQYYKGNGTMAATAAITILSTPTFFVGGAIGGGIIAGFPTKTKNWNVSDPNLLANEYYTMGFKEKAQKKKVLKVLEGFGIGVGAIIFSLFFLFRGGYGY